MKNILITIIFLFSTILVEAQELKFNDFLHYNNVGSDHVNSSVEIQVASTSDINYNFSHSVLTNGKPYNQFVKQNGGKFTLPITPRILDTKYIDEDNALIISNSGLYLFNVSSNELTLLKESKFDKNGKLISYFSEIVSMENNVVTLKSGTVVSIKDASDFYSTSFKDNDERSSALSKLNKTTLTTFCVDTANKKLLNL